MDGYFIAFLIGGIVAHELGHAAVARLVGGEVTSITIGTGPLLVRTHLGGVGLTLRLIPLSGLTSWQGAAAQQRWRRLAVALAGCAVNLGCAVGVIIAGVHDGVRLQLLITSLALGWYNLLPVRTLNGAALDGLTAARLIRGSATTLTTEQLDAARRDPLAPSSVALRERLRRQVDRDRDLTAARLLAQLPAGEPARPGRPAGDDLERLRRLVCDDLLPAGSRAVLAYQAVVTGLPGRDPQAEPLSDQELAWCASMMALAAQLSPRAWPVLQTWALTLALQGPTGAPRALELARQALDWAASSPPKRTDAALLQATAALAAATAGEEGEAVARRDQARSLDADCPTLALVDAALAQTRPPTSPGERR